jgi:threonine aldolase
MDRRHFLAATGLAAASPMFANAAAGAGAGSAEGLFQRIDFNHDGLGLSPREYAARLHDVVNSDFASDYYSRGGEIEALERKFARRLGKQAAMFVPTGTLANHLAVRRLAGANRRVLVQAESHLYNDSGDGAQTLSGLNLVPLAEGETTIALADVQRWVERSAGGRVENKIGAISIETPVRRRDHAMVDFAELERVCHYAREQGIRRHLDGARLFSLPLHSGKSVSDYAALFDTVYVSLWKHFNGATGAILAGDADFIEGLFHARRMFGGALPYAWPQVALVGGHLDSYEADYAKSWQAADRLIALLEASGRFKARRLADGTSRFFLSVSGIAPALLAERASARGISLPGAVTDAGEFVMQVNPTLLRAEPDDVARRILGALAG